MTDERMREALERAADFAESMRQIFADPYFTDRHDDAGRCERMRDYLREALSAPAPEARTEHEWVNEHGDLLRVRWSSEHLRWGVDWIPPGCRNYHAYGGTVHYALAAEIAKFAGLVVPKGRTMSEAPKRAIELTLKVSADTWNDVRHRLFDYEEMIRRDGGISPGCMGGPSSGDIREVTLDPDMTNERYFELLGAWLDELHEDEATERKGEG